MQSVPKVAIRSRGTGERNHVEVTRACGHKEVIEVYGDPAKSQWLDSARLRDCKLCYSQKQQGADEQAVADGKRVALDGTEKQIAWAGTIRQRRAVEFGKAMRDLEALVVAGKVTPEAAKDPPLAETALSTSRLTTLPDRIIAPVPTVRPAALAPPVTSPTFRSEPV